MSRYRSPQLRRASSRGHGGIRLRPTVGPSHVARPRAQHPMTERAKGRPPLVLAPRTTGRPYARSMWRQSVATRAGRDRGMQVSTTAQSFPGSHPLLAVDGSTQVHAERRRPHFTTRLPLPASRRKVPAGNVHSGMGRRASPALVGHGRLEGHTVAPRQLKAMIATIAGVGLEKCGKSSVCAGKSVIDRPCCRARPVRACECASDGHPR